MDLNDVQWRKSSHSGGNGGECVEVGALPAGVAVRDSKDPHGPRIVMSRADFRRFAETLKGR